MTVMCTFAGITVSAHVMTDRTVESTNILEISFNCVTTDPTEIPALQALVGPLSKNRLMNKKVMLLPSTTYKGTLVFNGSAITNCAIQSLKVAEADGSFQKVFPYSISFVKDTSI